MWRPAADQGRDKGASRSAELHPLTSYSLAVGILPMRAGGRLRRSMPLPAPRLIHQFACIHRTKPLNKPVVACRGLSNGDRMFGLLGQLGLAIERINKRLY